MQFQVKKSENGRNNIFRDKQTTNKVYLTLLDLKMPTEMKEGYRVLLSIWKPKKKKTVKKVSSSQKAKSKVRMMFCDVKMQQDRCRWFNYKLNWKSSGNNVFRKKLTTNKIPPNRDPLVPPGTLASPRYLEVRRKLRLMLWRPKVNER